MRNYLKGLYIEIISRCNEKCIYCYNEKNMTDCVMLPYGKTADIISNAVKMGVENIAISGGEPFLHPEIKEIISIINENGLTPTIITNLTLLDVEMSEFLSGKKVNLQLTLDSGIEEIHELSRGKGTYGKQVRAIGLLKSHGFSDGILLRCNIWGKNCSCENILSVLDFAREYGISTVNFALAHRTDFFCLTAESEREKEDIINWIESAKKIYPKLDIDFPEGKVSWACPFLVDEEHLDCGLRITAAGNVYPCQMFDSEEFCIGNIYSNNLEEIIEGDPFRRFLELMRLRKFFIQKCRECVCQVICYGGCPVKALLDNKNILTVEGTCEKRMYYYKEMLKNAVPLK